MVMLDGECSFQTLAPQGVHIWWGAYLGTADEVLVTGPLVDVRDEILRIRKEKRAAKGWVMDIYLLRKVEP